MHSMDFFQLATWIVLHKQSNLYFSNIHQEWLLGQGKGDGGKEKYTFIHRCFKEREIMKSKGEFFLS